MKISPEFIRLIPKTDLHLHLDGSLRLSTLIDLARRNHVALPADSEQGLKEKVFKDHYQSLEEYLQGFAYTTAVLQDEESLERVAYELAEDNLNEGVRYIEVRYAPQLHQSEQMNCIAVMKAVNRGLTRARDEFNRRPEICSGQEPPFEYGFIVCAMRMFAPGFSRYFDALLNVHQFSERKWIFSLASQELVKAAVEARNQHGVPVVGFDLAGMEKGYPAVDHKLAYELAHRNFFKKTVHAGEAFGPESIFQAITELYADRIGHGVHLFDWKMIRNNEIEDKKKYVENLIQYIADRRITIEVCLTSNLQTNPAIKNLSQHSFGKMRQARLSATFCTDNRTISSTSVSAEILKAVEAFDISAKELKDFVVYGFKRSFYPGSYLVKRRYVRQIIEFYEKIEKRFP